jgi:Tfp pilus assembly protein PilF
MMAHRMAMRVVCLLVAALFFGSVPHRTGAQQSSSREEAYRLNNIGVARLEQYDYAAAATVFRRVLDIDPGLPAAHLNLALALLYDSQFDAAEREARAASEQMPKSPQPPYVLGLIARASGRSTDAITWFRRVLALDPGDAGANIQLGQALVTEQQYVEAIALLQTAAKSEPFNASAAYALATALARAGRSAESQTAMAHFQRLRDNPAAVTYSSTYLGQGRYAEAIVSTGLEPDLVDAATPAVSFIDATTAMMGSAESASAGARRQQVFGAVVDRNVDAAIALESLLPDLARSVALVDVDSDGDLDVLYVSSRSVVLRRNQSGRFDALVEVRIDGITPLATVPGDYDNDGRPDLFIVGYPANRLYHQEPDGGFRDVTQQTGIPAATGLARTAAFVDIDHDGDLDIFIGGLARASWQGTAIGDARFPQSFAAASNQLLRNNGNGRFADVTDDSRLASVSSYAVGVVPTDFDNHRDIDLFVVPYGDRPILFSNLRDGTFKDVSAEIGMPAAAQYTVVAAADINKDGASDFFLGRSGAAGALALSTGAGGFTVTAAPDESRDAIAAQSVDYDNDGLLDLLVLTINGPRLWRNVGNSWVNVTDRALPAGLTRADDPPVGMGTGDLDGDGDVDAIVRLASGRVRAWRNDGGNTNKSLRVRLTARVSNRSAVGSKVEMRAGSLRQKIETSSATPSAAPADVLFGLGARTRADVVRVLWPAGILQAEIDLPEAAASTLQVTELDRKPSSCPFLYTWNGSRFAFVTDFMGGGEMGSWVGPEERSVPDADEYVRIRGDQLREHNGKYELRVTNELEEALFVDQLQLMAIAHPPDLDVYPNEGLRSPAAREPFTLYAVRDPHPPRRASDDHGHDVRDRIAALDRRYVDDFSLEPIQGYAREHTLSFEIDQPRGRSHTLLLLTGWTEYAFSSDNLAAHQAGLLFRTPALQIFDASGVWQTVVPEIGLPVGRPQTIVVDLTETIARRGIRLPSATQKIRIITTARVYWDQILVATSASAPYRTTRMDALEADLHWRGFSDETSSDGQPPFSYDYHRVSPLAPWKTFPGRYTKFGDVKALLATTDDRFAVMASGDEIALRFDARAVPPLPNGWTRTYLLYADGFSKEMNLHSASPDRLEPLPFHRMTRYPYSRPEHYPNTPVHNRYLAEYNTRTIGGPLPPLESALVRK